MSRQIRSGAATPSPADSFFLPDLCAPPMVLSAMLLAELLVVVHILVASLPGQFDWLALGLFSILVQWCVLFSTVLLCVLRRYLVHLSNALATAVILGVVAVVAALSSLLALSMVPLGLGAVDANGWVLRNVLAALILAAIVFRYFYLQRQLTLQQQAELQARLSSLRARVQPHFLFNTLNSIASLIATCPEQAETAVEDVAELLRASLREGESETSVARELELCECYLAIERLRLGDALRVDWSMPEDVRAARLPSLLLQMLLENAVNHGIARLMGGGVIRVVLEPVDSELRISVVNPVAPGNLPEAGSGERVALANIRQRLEGLYPGQHRFRAGPAGDSYAVVVRLPLRVEP